MRVLSVIIFLCLCWSLLVASNPTTSYKCCNHHTDCTGTDVCIDCNKNGSPWVTLCQDNVPSCGSTTAGICEPSTFGQVFVQDDPHFKGLNGHKYEFQGEPNKVFALISEPHVQVNARFVNASNIKNIKDSHRGGIVGTTVMGEICVRFCDSTVTFDSKGSFDFSGPASSNLLVKRHSRTTVNVSAGLWSFTVMLDTRHDHWYLNLHNVMIHLPVFAGSLHGVLGVTAPSFSPLNGTHPHCQAKNEGGCEVPGEWHEYEVQGNDLCGTEFKYSKFDSNKCSSIAANPKRGSSEVNLLQQAEQSLLK